MRTERIYSFFVPVHQVESFITQDCRGRAVQIGQHFIDYLISQGSVGCLAQVKGQEHLRDIKLSYLLLKLIGCWIARQR